jgi:hypothetical protein
VIGPNRSPIRIRGLDSGSNADTIRTSGTNPVAVVDISRSTWLLFTRVSGQYREARRHIGYIRPRETSINKIAVVSLMKAPPKLSGPK